MKQLSVLLIFLLQFSGFSQTNFQARKGYIITNTNDTIQGEIIYNPCSYSKDKLIFTNSNNDEAKEYLPEHLIGFKIEPDLNYKVISVKENELKVSVESKHFVLRAVEGEIEFLVLYLDNGEERFFIRNDEFGLTELLQIVVIENGVKRTTEKYKSELGKYFYKYPEFQKKLRKINLSYHPISRIIYEHNQKFNKPTFHVAEKKDKWHLMANLGFDYYLGEKIQNDINVPGILIGFKSSYYQPIKNFKTELGFGINYRTYSFSKNLVHYIDKNGNIIVNALIPNDPSDTSFVFTKVTSLYKEKADIFEIPIFFEYNNKVKLISPIFQGGIKPYLIKKKSELELHDPIVSEWKLNTDLILSFGLGLNYKRFNIKYLIHLTPLLLNSLELSFKINQ